MELSTATDVVLQQGGGGGGATVLLIVYLLLIVASIAGMWRVFTKAGQPGWAAIVPIYNLYVMLKVADDPGWWLIGMFIPLVNLIVFIVVGVHVSQAFGRGVGFGLGLAFLGFIFWPLLGFGDYAYRGAPA